MAIESGEFTRRERKLVPFLFQSSIIIILSIALAFFASAEARAETVARVEISGLSSIGEEKVKELIEIKEGDNFSYGMIEKAESILKEWGIFDLIKSSVSRNPEGSIVKFELHEAKVVASIDIVGNYPYIENKIRKNLSLHTGDIFTPEKLGRQTERLKAFYAREGYVGTEVYVDEEEMPDWGGVILTFHIRRGFAMRIRSIDVAGNHAYPKGRFVSAINPARQFSERRLSDSIRKLREFYAGHGYPKARIKVREKKMDFDAHRVDLALDVSEGPHVKIVFDGARHINRKLLRRTVTILKEGSIDSYEIESSAGALRDLFKARGYPDARVAGERSELPDGTILITFTIDEGEARRIKFLKFEGNEDVGAGALKENMQNREKAFGRFGAYDPEAVHEDNKSILKAFSRKGYLNARVDEWRIAPTKQGYALDVTIPVEENQRTLVGEVSFVGNRAFDTPKLLRALKIKPGKPIDTPGLEEDRQRLIALYADNGYPYADITQSWEKIASTGTALIRYHITEDSLVRIGEILFLGDVLTSQKAIRHAMDIREGDAFSYKKIIDSQLAIRRLGPFAAVNIEAIGIEEREPVVHLKVKVEEQRPFTVDMGFAYSSLDGFTGSLSFANLNAFGWAKTNTLKLIAGQRFSRAELGWYDPRFVSSSFEMTANAWIQYKQRPAYAFTQGGGSVGWIRRLRRLNFLFRYELNRNYFVQGDSVAADADSLKNNAISRISLSSSFDSRDSFSNPTRGFYTLGGVSIFNGIMGNKANFAKFSWQGENDFGFFRRFVLTTDLRFDRIEAIGSNVSIPENELLFLGGDFTIRGFAEDSLGPQNANGRAIGATTRWIANEELRIKLWHALEWAFFVDAGSLTNSFSAIGNSSIRRSAGLGLRYITPVGPVRLDYGFKLDRRTNESAGDLHFTFGFMF